MKCMELYIYLDTTSKYETNFTQVGKSTIETTILGVGKTTETSSNLHFLIEKAVCTLIYRTMTNLLIFLSKRGKTQSDS